MYIQLVQFSPFRISWLCNRIKFHKIKQTSQYSEELLPKINPPPKKKSKTMPQILKSAKKKNQAFFGYNNHTTKVLGTLRDVLSFDTTAICQFFQQHNCFLFFFISVLMLEHLWDTGDSFPKCQSMSLRNNSRSGPAKIHIWTLKFKLSSNFLSLFTVSEKVSYQLFFSLLNKNISFLSLLLCGSMQDANICCYYENDDEDKQAHWRHSNYKIPTRTKTRTMLLKKSTTFTYS